MFITKEILVNLQACPQGIKWFERYFPNGAELIEVINHKYVSEETLHWGYTNLITSEEEREAYRKKLGIQCECPLTIYRSKEIVNSKYITSSRHVADSNYIFDSEDISNCENVTSTTVAEHSKNIYSSEFVYNSRRIIGSKNITGSQDIIFSNCVINSHDIAWCSNIKWSGFVSDFTGGRTKELNHCYFISNSRELDHCLFCTNLIGAEYCLFNKHITPEEYDIYVKQLNSILKDWRPELVLNDHWPGETIPLDYPAIQRNIYKQYINLPDKFWRWVKTLPGYDADIMYSIVFNPKAF